MADEPARAAAAEKRSSLVTLVMWLILLSISLTFLVSAITYVTIDQHNQKVEKKFRKSKSPLEWWFFVVVFIGSLSLLSVIYHTLLHNFITKKREGEKQKRKEEFFSSLKVFVDFTITAIMFVYGVVKPGSNHCIWHAKLLAIGGGALVFFSNVMGFLFLQGSVQVFNICSTAFLQALVYYGGDKRWLTAGIVGGSYLLITVAYLGHRLNRWRDLSEVTVGVIWGICFAGILVLIILESYNLKTYENKITAHDQECG